MAEPAPIRTTCPYCGVGCGVLARPAPDGTVEIAGDPAHPANRGRLCSKGAALGETLGHDGRLLHPEISGARADWESALDLVARRFSETIAAHGPDSVALYVSGQFLTEDYYVANKLMKGFIGSANIDSNSRLCMASSVAGHRRAFGTDTVPGNYEDIEQADLVVLVGSNLAWCHPVLFQRLAAARAARGTRLVVIDPRRTVTAEAADLHLEIEPDGDLPLFLGLLHHLDAEGRRDPAYLAAHVGDPGPALAAAASYDVARVARETGLAPAAVAAFFRLFAETERVVSVYSQGINQSVSGSDKVNAILNCHLLTGRIGRPGMGPFSITGQPNAMGGREVGGLANMLAAHLAIEDPRHRDLVRRFWAAPRLAEAPGLKAVDMFRAVRDGRIRALWIMATNPADSLPDADDVQEALRDCPFVVVSDAMRETDTTRFAHVLLPSAAWGEKDGTVTNSERRISRQRAFRAPPGAARPDWWQLTAVARRMGFAGFEYAGPADIFREHAALSGFEPEMRRDFDISAHAMIDAEAYAALAPFQWPLRPGSAAGQARFFAEGGFFTPDGRARMVATPVPAPVKQRAAEFPLWLNTGRIRDQWHTMTRTGQVPRLSSHSAEPFCEIHPQDAAEAGIAPAGLVEVRTARGSGLFRAHVTERQRRGAIFVPMHWTDRFAARGRINAATDPAADPVSGQPGLKASPAALRPFRAAWHGFAVSVARPRPEGLAYWALAHAEGGFQLELAGAAMPEDWQNFAAGLFQTSEDAEWVAYYDAEAGLTRLAAFAGRRLLCALFTAPEPLLIARGFVAGALGGTHAGMARLRLLAGQGGAERPDPGPILCACFAVGVNEITAAIRAGRATNVEEVGALLKAGTNCGSCRGEIRRLIDEHPLEKAV
ncbi:nitrate reductase [Rhabdaerophilum calidifontis]|uniref:nitrate reductase n=1 Tax=Rhabdaerophilum calidifontis TaxID=2604328 RepID=UPI001239FFD8|nr:nitrate reductase [Rhabdaerophilum calidifontis]